MNVDIIATDGDATRRRVLSGMMKPVKDNTVQVQMKKMPLFDTNLVSGKRALYFDDKHNGKRLRGAVISDTRGSKIDGIVISKDQLKYLFTKAGINNIHTILDPNDKQNVAAVLNLFKALDESLQFCENSNDQVLSELKQPIKILYSMFDGILSIFCDPTINLGKQLVKLSKLAHILLYQYKKCGTSFLPGQLYHDLQRMIQGCYFACIIQQKRGGGKLYLYQLGTDQLERLFSTIRTITHARNCDSLELCQRLSHAETLEFIISKHPEWKRMHGKRLCGNKDSSSQREWTGELEVNNLDVQKLWNTGQAEAVNELKICVSFFTDLSTVGGITMMRPNKRLVGVNVDNERIEPSLTPVVEDVQQAEDNIASLEIEEMVQDGYDSNDTGIQNSILVEVSGSMVYKATIVKEILNGDVELSSADRLRRVRGYTKHPGTTEVIDSDDGDLDLDDAIMLGDVLSVKVKYDGTSVVLAFVKITSMKNKNNNKYETIIPAINIGDFFFDGRIYEGKITNDILILKNASIEEMCYGIDGNLCILVQLRGLCIEREKVMHLMKQIPLSSKAISNSKLLPYDECLKELQASNEMEGENIKCKLCSTIIQKKKMRKHVGTHILKDNLMDVCGFCGLSGCTIDIIRGSGRGKTASKVVSANCEYMEKFSLTSTKKITKSSPCTNRPVTCPHCNTVHWSYNMYTHMKKDHSDYPPDEWKISEEEVKAVKN